MIRTFDIEGERVESEESEIKLYCYIGEGFDREGKPLSGEIFQRNDGKLIIHNKIESHSINEVYDQEGKEIKFYLPDFFLIDSFWGVEYNNKFYIIDLIKEI